MSDDLEQAFRSLNLTDRINDLVQTQNFITEEIVEPTLRRLFNPNNTVDVTMTQFKHEYLNCVPNFSGNPNELNEFLATADSIVETFFDRQNPHNFINVFILKSIQNKITGDAKVAVNIQHCATWEDLKTALKRNFSDQRDEVCLIRDLVLSKQGSDQPKDYFEKCINLLNLLCSYVDAHETLATSKETKRTLYNKLTLKTFLAGLKEPLGSSIRAMRPNTMQEALQYINEENNIRYCQKDFVKPTTNNGNNNSGNRSNQVPRIQYRANTPMFNNQNQNKQFNQGRPANNNNPGPSKQNVFAPNPNFKSSYQPTPMSVSTNHTNRPFVSQRANNFQLRNRVVPEELYNTESVTDNFMENTLAATENTDDFPEIDFRALEENAFEPQTQNFQELTDVDPPT